MSEREQERREKALAWFRQRVGDGTTLPTLEQAFMDGHRSRDEEVAALLYKIEAMDLKFTVATEAKDAEIAKLCCQVEAMQVEIDGYAKFNAAAETEIAWLRTGIRDFLCECALVEDFHRNYEVWQITKGSMVELRELLEKKS